MTIWLLIAVTLCLISIGININLLRKNEYLEDIINDAAEINKELYDMLVLTKSRIDESYDRIKKLDRRGSFESDDEVGFFFNDLLTISENLKNSIQADEEEQENIESNE